MTHLTAGDADIAPPAGVPGGGPAAAAEPPEDVAAAPRSTPALAVQLGLSEPQSERFGRAGLLVLLLIVSLLFVYVVRIFLTPVILAAVFVTLAFPLQSRMLALTGGRRGPAALLSCVLLVGGVLIPIYISASFVRHEVTSLYLDAQPHIGPAVERLRTWAGELALADGSGTRVWPSWLPSIPLGSIDWGTSLQNLASTAGNLLASMLQSMSRSTVILVFNVFVVLFTMFYFFRDGESIVARLRAVSPLDHHYEELLIERLIWVSRATLRGSVIVGAIQSTIGAATLWITGIQAPFLWWLVMVIVSVIPLVGSWLVMYPMAILHLLSGRYWQGVTIILVSVVVISNIDNILRPRLVGRHARMHDLVVFFATLGGISVFGVMGFIVGPIIAALFIALMDIYALEFRSQLARAAARRRPAEGTTPDAPAAE